MNDLRQEVMTQAVYGAPSYATIIMKYLMSIDLNHWVGYSSILYCTLQSLYLLWRWRKDVKDKDV